MPTDKMSLGDRMKCFYENVSRYHLTRRTPTIVRLDGKSFHTFTRGLNKPYDTAFSKCMELTTLALCQRVQGCKLAYTQSDEISLVLTDYDSLDTCAWFDNNIQKMVSVSASIAGVYFNLFARKYLHSKVCDMDFVEEEILEREEFKNLPVFDSRAFNLPKEEVCNYVYWRQLDATRNSIQSLGQAHFSHKELHGKDCNEIQDMLMVQKGINWNDTPTKFKRGLSFYRKYDEDEKSTWIVDYEMPILSQDRDYIETLIF